MLRNLNIDFLSRSFSHPVFLKGKRFWIMFILSDCNLQEIYFHPKMIKYVFIGCSNHQILLVHRQLLIRTNALLYYFNSELLPFLEITVIIY